MQRFASELELQAGLQPSNDEAAEAYATPDIWQKCADGLNSTLAGHHRLSYQELATRILAIFQFSSYTSDKVLGVQLLATPVGSSCSLRSLNIWPIFAMCFTPCWSSASEMSVSVLSLMTTSSVCGQT